jgi:hypothetical protein
MLCLTFYFDILVEPQKIQILQLTSNLFMGRTGKNKTGISAQLQELCPPYEPATVGPTAGESPLPDRTVHVNCDTLSSAMSLRCLVIITMCLCGSAFVGAVVYNMCKSA